jgi:hypothetical protein
MGSNLAVGVRGSEVPAPPVAGATVRGAFAPAVPWSIAEIVTTVEQSDANDCSHNFASHAFKIPCNTVILCCRSMAEDERGEGPEQWRSAKKN